MRQRKKNQGGLATAEGAVESVHEGVGLSEDDDPRTGEGIPAEPADAAADDGTVTPKNADRLDPFPSSELADRLGPYNKTTS
jgi:hypothetical protein